MTSRCPPLASRHPNAESGGESLALGRRHDLLAVQLPRDRDDRHLKVGAAQEISERDPLGLHGPSDLSMERRRHAQEVTQRVTAVKPYFEKVTSYVPERRVTSNVMAAKRGTRIKIPQWWIGEMEAAMKARGWSRPSLVAALAKTEDREAPAYGAAKTRVSRFLDGTIQTTETADEIRSLLDLPPYQVTIIPQSRSQALTLEGLQRDPSEIHRSLAVSRFMDSLQAGEVELDEAIENGIERHSPVVKSGDAGASSSTQRRRSSHPRHRSKATRDE